MTLIEYAAPQASYIFSGVEPGLSEYAVEAWERMTWAGLKILAIVEAPAPQPEPWGINRFREPTPPGGLRLVSWDDVTR